jgi:hypothetical protein
MIKTTVGEYEKFYNDDSFWPKNTVIEEEAYMVGEDELCYDEVFELPKETKVIIDGGFCRDEGVVDEDSNYKDLGSLTANFNKWKKMQKSIRLLVEVDKEKEHELLDFVKKLGGKVIK